PGLRLLLAHRGVLRRPGLDVQPQLLRDGRRLRLRVRGSGPRLRRGGLRRGGLLRHWKLPGLRVLLAEHRLLPVVSLARCPSWTEPTPAAAARIIATSRCRAPTRTIRPTSSSSPSTSTSICTSTSPPRPSPAR